MTQYVLVGIGSIGHRLVSSLVAQCLVALASESVSDMARSNFALQRRSDMGPDPEADIEPVSDSPSVKKGRNAHRYAAMRPSHRSAGHKSSAVRLHQPRGIHRDGIQAKSASKAHALTSSVRSGRRNGSRK